MIFSVLALTCFIHPKPLSTMTKSPTMEVGPVPFPKAYSKLSQNELVRPQTMPTPISENKCEWTTFICEKIHSHPTWVHAYMGSTCQRCWLLIRSKPNQNPLRGYSFFLIRSNVFSPFRNTPDGWWNFWVLWSRLLIRYWHNCAWMKNGAPLSHLFFFPMEILLI